MDTNKYPKVLIISHNVLGLTKNMGRFLHDTFIGWPTDKLGQIYIYSEDPTTDLCKNYFRITDFDIINSIIRRKKPGKKIVFNEINNGCSKVNENHNKIYNKGRKRTVWTYIVRNAIWRLGTWKTKELLLWIESFSPDVIYFASGDYVFLYRIVQYIANRYNIPVFTAIYDDYYFSSKSKGLFTWLKNTEYKREFKKMLNNSFQVSYASSVMKKLYDNEFGLSGFVQYKSTKFVTQKETLRKNPVISYAGGLSLNRWKSLVKVGRAVKEIYPHNEVWLDVYSGETDKDILEKMTKENGICFKGKISAKEVENVILDSNILLVVESFDNDTRERIRCSLSTKIADYLGSNRCIFAYGPDDVGSIVYLSKNGTASVVTNDDDLKVSLIELIFNENIRQKYVQKAKEIAKKNHSEEVIHEKLKNVLSREII